MTWNGANFAIRGPSSLTKAIILFEKRKFSHLLKLHSFYSWMHCQVRLQLAQWFWVWSIIWKTLNPLYPSMLCAKLCWNCYSGSGEDEHIKGFRQCHWTMKDNRHILIRKALLFDPPVWWARERIQIDAYKKNKANLYY